MQAFVTGIGGFAGSHLAEALLEQGWEVAGALAPGEAAHNLAGILDQLDLCTVDLADPEACARAILDVRPTCIFHLAAVAFVPDSLARPLHTYDVNVRGTLQVLEVLRQHLPNTRLVCVTSGDAYGDVAAQDLPLDEAQRWRPVNPYAATKAAADVLAAAYTQQYGLPIVRARPFNHTGPRQSPRFVCADFARQIARIETGITEPVLRVGRLTARRDFSDVRDVVRAYCLLSEAGVPAGAYNICSERAVAISEILTRLLELARIPIDVVEEASRVRSTDAKDHCGSAARLRAATGWQQEISLDTTLADTLAYWREAVADEVTQQK